MPISGISNPITPDERDVVAIHNEMQSDINYCEEINKEKFVVVVIKKVRASEREIEIERYTADSRIMEIIYRIWGFFRGTVVRGEEAKKVLLLDLMTKAEKLAMKVKNLRINSRIDFSEYGTSLYRTFEQGQKQVNTLSPQRINELGPLLQNATKRIREVLKWITDDRMNPQIDFNRLMGEMQSKYISSQDKIDKGVLILKGLKPTAFDQTFINVYQEQVLQAIQQAMNEQEAKELTELRGLYNRNGEVIEKLRNAGIDPNTRVFSEILSKQTELKEKIITQVTQKCSDIKARLQSLNRESYRKSYKEMEAFIKDIGQDQFIADNPRVIEQVQELGKTFKKIAQTMADNVTARLNARAKIIPEEIDNAKSDFEEYQRQGKKIAEDIANKELQLKDGRIQKEMGIRGMIDSNKPLLQGIIDATNKRLDALRKQLAKEEAVGEEKEVQSRYNQIADALEEAFNEKVTMLSRAAAQKTGEEARRLSAQIAEAGKSAMKCRELKSKGIAGGTQLYELAIGIPEAHAFIARRLNSKLSFPTIWNQFAAQAKRVEGLQVTRDEISRLDTYLKETEANRTKIVLLYDRRIAHQSGEGKMRQIEEELGKELVSIQNLVRGLNSTPIDPDELFPLLDAAEAFSK